MTSWAKISLVEFLSMVCLASAAMSQATPVAPPTPEELVEVLQRGPSVGARGSYLTFSACPAGNTPESAIFEAISAARLPPASLVALGATWTNLLDGTCPVITAWYEAALDDVITAGDEYALTEFTLRLPQDIPEGMRESLLMAVRDGSYHQGFIEDALRRAMRHSDASVQQRFALRAFEAVEAQEAYVRDVISGESDYLYRLLGISYARSLAAAAPRLADETLRAAAYPIARRVSEEGGGGDVEGIRELRAALSGRSGMGHLVELLRPSG